MAPPDVEDDDEEWGAGFDEQPDAIAIASAATGLKRVG